MEQIEDREPSKEYLEAYNQGYMFAKYKPDEANKILSYSNESELLAGLKDGIEQYSNEQFEKTLPDYLKDVAFNFGNDDFELDIDNEPDLDK